MLTTAPKHTAKRRRKATIADVAKNADVSPATVSRFLSNPARVRQEKRSRIESAISELRYTPDAAARALATERSMTIGVVVPTLDLGSFAVGIEALQERLDAEGYMPLLTLSNFNQDLEARHVA
ncbi:MAG: LacI family transcriptional regulator, partial [bacterium]|nr:LacI family transcriptional regulator [bacterium]